MRKKIAHQCIYLCSVITAPVLNRDLQRKQGIEIEEMEIKDLTFPKSIQDLFSKHLEAKIRAKSDLVKIKVELSPLAVVKG